MCIQVILNNIRVYSNNNCFAACIFIWMFYVYNTNYLLDIDFTVRCHPSFNITFNDNIHVVVDTYKFNLSEFVAHQWLTVSSENIIKYHNTFNCSSSFFFLNFSSYRLTWCICTSTNSHDADEHCSINWFLNIITCVVCVCF